MLAVLASQLVCRSATLSDLMQPPPENADPGSVHDAGAYADLAAQAAAAMGRDDLARRVAAAKARLQNSGTAIAVVGEFKQGKSSLVNGVLGIDICPVDDDIATSTLTVLRHGDEAHAVVWCAEGSERVTRDFPVAALPSLVTEGSVLADGRVELVEVFLPNPLLAHGISIVDTPGANGIRPGYTAVVLGYLEAVHGAVFVTDASSPLTHEELAFLQAAVAVSPVTCIALAKIDLFPHWREIHSANADLLQRAGLAIPVFPVSSALRHAALVLNDGELNEESGFPDLIRFLDENLVQRATTIAALGMFDTAIFCLNEMRFATAADLAARRSPDTMADRLQAFRQAKERLERLKVGNARWATVMNDGLGELVSQVDHRFRRRMRDLQKAVDDEVAKSDPAKIWPDLTARVREQAAAGARDVIYEMETGADEVAARITALLAEDDLLIGSAVDSRPELELTKYWAPRPLSRLSVASGIGMGFTGLRGAQGGLILFGMLSGLAGIAVSTGVLAGVAAAFGGKQLLEERKRQVAARRQEARTAIRQSLDETEFEVGRTLRELSRDLNRRLRDHYSDRIGERLRTCMDAAASLERGLQEDEAARSARVAELSNQAGQLDMILDKLTRRRNELAATGMRQ